MTLAQHLQILGLDVSHFAFITKLPDAVIKRALNGQPIAAPHAETIAMKLSQQHRISVHPLDGQALKPEDIDGLVVVKPHELRSKKENQ